MGSQRSRCIVAEGITVTTGSMWPAPFCSRRESRHPIPYSIWYTVACSVIVFCVPRFYTLYYFAAIPSYSNTFCYYTKGPLRTPPAPTFSRDGWYHMHSLERIGGCTTSTFLTQRPSTTTLVHSKQKYRLIANSPRPVCPRAHIYIYIYIFPKLRLQSR